MNTHIKTLLSSSGIDKRNVNIHLFVIGNAHVPRLINPVNQTVRSINIQASGRKLMCQFSLHAFYPQSTSRFDDAALIQFP